MSVLRLGPLAAALLLTLLGWLATPALLGTAAAEPAVTTPPTAAAAAAGFGPAVLAELNRIRASSGLPKVGIDRRMSRTATAHSRDMARRGYFGHGSWGSRVARASGSASAVGEVLGWLPRNTPRSEAREIVRGWLNSPPHRQVLLDGQFRRIGIGRARGSLSGVSAAIYTVDWASAR
ncbi:CAP domain-containing protein [Conexibacter stalactiti]|uniref:CAP domain-containing protein n=1 Tax=Conexibacter stalactiti TaxID=1940611 RepID=A0ABU4HMJ6_9ACTN|nr:CAP domain-containing protein [Conexibacter stalactiti]MDW5594465.1 CAP domain-containing protein [Conexibacter stalactiti]MEC5035107.1 CAP domain-containing protein [Conexibacter stalactiti]